MKHVLRQWLAIVAAVGFTLSTLLMIAVNSLEQRIARLHLISVQECILDSSDMSARTAEECELRWQRAVKP
jgi:hypothetical protein